MGREDRFDGSKDVHGRAGDSGAGGWPRSACRCQEKAGQGKSGLEVWDGLWRQE